MIYLNKTCFNGLYQVNLGGHFNSSFGNHQTLTIDVLPVAMLYKMLTSATVPTIAWKYVKIISTIWIRPTTLPTQNMTPYHLGSRNIETWDNFANEFTDEEGNLCYPMPTLPS
jgi:hypothetical protein